MSFDPASWDRMSTQLDLSPGPRCPHCSVSWYTIKMALLPVPGSELGLITSSQRSLGVKNSAAEVNNNLAPGLLVTSWNFQIQTQTYTGQTTHYDSLKTSLFTRRDVLFGRGCPSSVAYCTSASTMWWYIHVDRLLSWKDVIYSQHVCLFKTFWENNLHMHLNWFAYGVCKVELCQQLFLWQLR